MTWNDSQLLKWLISFGDPTPENTLELLRRNIPAFECPDTEVQRTYYFRWWTFHQHLKNTPDGWIVTEFLPAVPWADKYNAIIAPAGHHFHEGRWLRDRKYLQSYARFWLRSSHSPRKYSSWLGSGLMALSAVSGDISSALELRQDLARNYHSWCQERRRDGELFWQNDGEDGMEISIGGHGYRTTINSYLIADLQALATLSIACGEQPQANAFLEEAEKLKNQMLTELWDDSAKFFKVRSLTDSHSLADVRELHGYTPWYFHLAPPSYDLAWQQLLDSQGFAAPFGLTTAERRHPDFMISYEGHECQWNGPSWPFATSMTLSALARTLQNRDITGVRREEYFRLFRQYALSQRIDPRDVESACWIDENLDPFTGTWIARERLHCWANEGSPLAQQKGGKDRGQHYNHSAFADHLISEVLGVKAALGDQLIIDPLLPPTEWEYFHLDALPYHNRHLSLRWSHDGTRPRFGSGFQVFVDGKLAADCPRLERLEIDLSNI